MKTIKSIAFFLLLASAPSFLFAKGEKKKTETITIQTSAVCGECNETIEGAVSKLSGVKKASLNGDDKKLTVIYQPNKISADEIKAAIAAAGYDADEVKANADAYNDLPMCCKKDGGH